MRLLLSYQNLLAFELQQKLLQIFRSPQIVFVMATVLLLHFHEEGNYPKRFFLTAYIEVIN